MSEGKTSVEDGVEVKVMSRNWKDRKEGYEELRERWSKGEEVDSRMVRQLGKETNIPAMEAAIDALLVVSEVRVADVKKMFVHLGSTKTSIRTRVEALVSRLKDTEGTVDALCEVLGSKSPKSIAGALNGICGMVRRGECKLETVGDRILEVMGHADKGVREAGVQLCIELYKLYGEQIEPYLSGLKGIQMKELRDSFGKWKGKSEDVAGGCEVPECVYRDAEDSQWKVRLEAMMKLRDMGKSVGNSRELIRVLERRVSDANNQVFQVVLEILCVVQPRNPEIVRGLFERLREKKSVVTERIKDTLEQMGVRVSGEYVEFLQHKNPQVRLNVLDYSLRNAEKDTRFIRAVGGCVFDPVSSVRDKAVEVLREVVRRHGDVVKEVVDKETLRRVNCMDRRLSSRGVEARAESKDSGTVRDRCVVGVETSTERKKEECVVSVGIACSETKMKDEKNGEMLEKPGEKEDGRSKRKYSSTRMDVLAKGVRKDRVKGVGSREEAFTAEFIRMMESGPFHQVVDLFDTVDKTVVSDFLIEFLVRNDASEASINSTLLSFISSKYILKECECKMLVQYLMEKGMREELEMMDRVYPVTKLFLVYQGIGSKEAHEEIVRLVRRYGMFRGNKRLFIEEMRRTRPEELGEIIRGCPDLLSFIDEIEGSVVAAGGEEGEESLGGLEDGLPVDAGCPDMGGRTKIAEGDGSPGVEEEIRAPRVVDDSFAIEDMDVEASFSALSIQSVQGVSTPNLKKFRREFETPVKQRRSDELEVILDQLIESDAGVSEAAFRRLMKIVDTNIDTLMFSSNSIVSSMSIQLFDMLDNVPFALLILNTFLKISQNKTFCEQLRKETLLNANSDLIKVMKGRGGKESGAGDTGTSSHEVSSIAGDILINLCLNCRPSVILEVYLDMVRSGREEILLKLIWRHSKCLRMEEREEVSRVLGVLSRFYDANYATILAEDNVTLKILQLHLKEMVKFYRERIYEFGVSGLMRVFVGCLMDGNDVGRCTGM